MDVWPIDWPLNIDVTTYDPAAVALAEQYAVASMRLLTLGRVGGDDLTAPAMGTTPVDAMGAYAAGSLAVEFLKLITNDRKCRLPSSITNVSRQGLTFEITRGMWPEGKTSLPEVDAYLMLWNPHGLASRPRVFTPPAVPETSSFYGVL